MFLLLLLVLLSTLYIFLKYHYSKWERRNFPQIKPSIPFGNLWDTIKQKRGFGFNIKDLHDSTKKPFIGIYLFFRPAILVRDPELIKNVLKIDFQSFHDRGIFADAEIDPLSPTLFALPGDKWKNLRSKLTPTFTSGKLKDMYPSILAIGKDLQDYLKQFADKNEVIDIREMASRYTINVIASVIFGVDVNTIRDKDHVFNKIGKNISFPHWMEQLRGIAVFLCPKFVQFFRIKNLEKGILTFFMDIVKQTINLRENNEIIRKDLMQLLIQIRNGGVINNINDWEVKNEAEKDKLMSIEQIASQAFLFFIAGFDTSSATTAFTLYELSKNEKLQKEVQAEIDEILKKHNGVISYDMIRESVLLDNCINETVRIYPGLPFLNRECTKNYQIPGTDHVIEKGTSIIISLLGLQRDPEHFINPMKFDPSRHLPENLNYTQSAYIPFGDGPRACIGIRMGRNVVKTALVLLLSKYDFKNDGPEELSFENTLALIAKGGTNLKISNRRM